MTIAFCFLTVGDLTQPLLWHSFFDKNDKCGIFCHPKNSQDVSTEFLKDNIIDDVIPTRHGDVSLVAATLNLLRAAFYREEYDHFILLSESTIPIVTFRAIEDELNIYKSKSLIKYEIAPPGTEHFNRQRALPQSIKMMPFFSHDQWVVLSRGHVRQLLDRPRLEWFAKMFAADEHYFLNVLAHDCRIGPDEIVNKRKTYVNWREREIKEVKSFDGKIIKRTIHPKTYNILSLDEVQKAKSEGNWFFRKISSQCDCRKLLDLTG